MFVGEYAVIVKVYAVVMKVYSVIVLVYTVCESVCYDCASVCCDCVSLHSSHLLAWVQVPSSAHLTLPITSLIFSCLTLTRSSLCSVHQSHITDECLSVNIPEVHVINVKLWVLFAKTL